MSSIIDIFKFSNNLIDKRSVFFSKPVQFLPAERDTSGVLIHTGLPDGCSHSQPTNPNAQSDSVMPRGLTDHGANSAAAM